jgi:hypothetical protein
MVRAGPANVTGAANEAFLYLFPGAAHGGTSDGLVPASSFMETEIVEEQLFLSSAEDSLQVVPESGVRVPAVIGM